MITSQSGDNDHESVYAAQFVHQSKGPKKYTKDDERGGGERKRQQRLNGGGEKGR